MHVSVKGYHPLHVITAQLWFWQTISFINKLQQLFIRYGRIGSTAKAKNFPTSDSKRPLDNKFHSVYMDDHACLNDYN